MSGGSFGYLAYKLEYEWRSGSILSELHNMIEFLHSVEKHEIADELQKIYDTLVDEVANDLLLKVIRDVEWWNSGDVGEETVDTSWKKYKESRCL